MTEAGALVDQVAVITGGGGGIGRSIALAMADAGAAVVVGDIVSERCDEVVDTVLARGGRAFGIPVDVMDTDDVRRLVAAADQRFGRIDILVNNAGGVSRRPFLEQSERSWRRHLDINVVSAFAATSAAVPIMIRGSRGGAIINVASLEGSRAAPGFAIYAAAKAALISFTRSTALEFAEHGIRVNAIAPDHTVTPGLRGNTRGPVDSTLWTEPTKEQADAMRRVIPLGREGDSDECGDAALFLASNASRYITGVVLPVDGGTAAAAGWTRADDGGWTLSEGLRFR